MSERIVPEAGSLDVVDQLRAAQTYWLDAAAKVNRARPDQPEYRAARIAYAVSILARLDWEQQGSGEQFEDAYLLGRVNELYFDGLARAAEAQGSVMAQAWEFPDYRTWRHYLHTQVYPNLYTRRSVQPGSHLELAACLKQGTAWVQTQPISAASV